MCSSWTWTPIPHHVESLLWSSWRYCRLLENILFSVVCLALWHCGGSNPNPKDSGKHCPETGLFRCVLHKLQTLMGTLPKWTPLAITTFYTTSSSVSRLGHGAEAAVSPSIQAVGHGELPPPPPPPPQYPGWATVPGLPCPQYPGCGSRGAAASPVSRLCHGHSNLHILFLYESLVAKTTV